MLAQGYKIVNTSTRLAWSKKDDGVVSRDYYYGHIFLEKGDEQLDVDCSDSEVSSMYYEQVADIDGTFFDRVVNQEAKADTTMYTYDYFSGDVHIPIINVEKKDIIKNKKVIPCIEAFVKSKLAIYSKNNFGKKLFNLFTDTIIVFEDRKGIHTEIFDKEDL